MFFKKIKKYFYILFLIFGCVKNEHPTKKTIEESDSSTENKLFDEKGFPFYPPGIDKKENEIQLSQTNWLEYFKQIRPEQLKKSPNIIFIVVDTLRGDYFSKEYSPNLVEFSKDAVFPEVTISGSTTTQPSMYNMLYGMPAMLFLSALKNDTLIGSPYLNILKKSGYTIYGMGKHDITCLKEKSMSNFLPYNERSYLRSTELLYGYQSHLFSQCVKSGKIGNEEFLYQNNHAAEDRDFYIQLKNTIFHSNSNGKNFFIMHTHGAHDNYGSYDSIDATKIPYKVGRLYPAEWAYINQIRSQDAQLLNLFRFLKQKNLYDESFIIILSDHGEHFRPNYDRMSGWHGHVDIKKEISHVPMLIKYPKSDLDFYRGSTNRVVSTADAFPSILEYLGLWNSKIESYVIGRPVSQKGIHAVLNYRIPTPADIALYIDPLKITLRYIPFTSEQNLENITSLRADDFKVISIEDFDDKPWVEPIPKIENVLNYREFVEGILSKIK